MSDSEHPLCDRINFYNRTDFIKGFEGIPQNITLNIVAFTTIFFTFCVLRKRAWNYGRIALFFHKDEEKLVAYDYNVWHYAKLKKPLLSTDTTLTSTDSTSGSTIKDNYEPLFVKHSTKPIFNYNKWFQRMSEKTSITEKNLSNKEPLYSKTITETISAISIEFERNNLSESYRLITDKTSDFDQGLFNWIRFYWKISDKEFEEKAGSDAYHYLLFVKYLICVTFFLMILCLGVMLPIHIYGSSKNLTEIQFISTTIMNLNSDSYFIWLHALLSLLLYLMIICVIWHYAYRVKLVTYKETTNILMIEGIPKKFCFKNIITEHFRLAYPDINVIDVHFAHNVKKLINLRLKREIAQRTLNDGKRQLELMNVRPSMVRYHGCRLCKCCMESIDLIDYYETEIPKLDLEIERNTHLSFENKIGIAFLTLDTIGNALRIRKDYHSECFIPNHPKETELSKKLNTANWNVTFAPQPSNIKWENLCTSSKKWYFKAFLINLLVFIFLFLLTTPTYFINLMEVSLIEFLPQHNIFHRLIQSFLMWLASVVLPYIVYNSEYMIGHWTRTQEHRAVIIKTTIFLMMMILIFPSLGIASLPAFIQWLIPQEQNNTDDGNGTISTPPSTDSKYVLQVLCIYAPGNFAFFVNYLITASFMGSMAELVRIPELVRYFYHLIVVRSSVEMWGIRRKMLWEYQFGLSYAWLHCVLAVTVTYSIICPLVVPFGFLYMVLRYCADRYNLYYAYRRSYIDGKTHRLALSFTALSFLFLQVNLLAYLRVKGIEGNLIYVFMLISFLLSLILYIACAFNGWFIQNKTRDPDPSTEKPEFPYHTVVPTWTYLFNAVAPLNAPGKRLLAEIKMTKKHHPPNNPK